MKKLLLLTVLPLFILHIAYAGRISGKVSDDKGKPLAYASVFIKGSSIGTTANNQGEYYLDLEPGAYTILCQYVGYSREEKKVTIGAGRTELNFTLSPQQTTMKEVVVHAGGEDPAYEIIRQAIKKKKDYVSPLDSFTCEAYIKTLMKTRKIGDRIL
ncbi:MAG TPA: carboxypeptidase-like regulatory domain-containing protein, partial [Chitinophagaceae bacterium]|nr:carboxypeptidase-like regulatory domain-containing protein [Chitinophagaceae bacterium]